SNLNYYGGPVSVTIPASPFMQKLGYGTGVNVYLMKRSPRGLSHSPWAVKKINSKCNGGRQNIYQQRLKEEAKILKNLQHPNIVGKLQIKVSEPLSGSGGPEPRGVMAGRIHEAWLSQTSPCPLSFILNDSSYLHNDKKLLHGDIKSSNVVVKGDFEAIKICDVGVSLPLDENMTVSNPEAYYIGTEPWKPKEALEDDGIITDKADIFPFGLTLWEMMTLSVPHFNLGDNSDNEDESFDEDCFDEEAYYAALGTRPALNMDELDQSYQHMIDLFSVCTSEDPTTRPSATAIVEALEASLPQE
uniref:PDZ binding kinase n=1 Tax=Otus sunia TaxID=257818 RepID=A0A8C8AZV6_9STRI